MSKNDDCEHDWKSDRLMLRIGDLVWVTHVSGLGEDMSYLALIDYHIDPFWHVRRIGCGVYAGGYYRTEQLAPVQYVQMPLL